MQTVNLSTSARSKDTNITGATDSLLTKVDIARRGRGGVIRIHYHSEEELMRLYDLLSQRAGGKA